MSRTTTANTPRLVTRLSDTRAARRLASASVLWLVLVAGAGLVGALAAGHLKIGLGLAGLVLVAGIVLADPVMLAVLALPGALLIERVGGASTNLSLADLLVFLAGLVSLGLVRWSAAGYLKQFLRGVVWYQAVLVLVVLAHPNRYNVVDWFHRFSYLAASVLVGWVIATHGRTRQAFRLYLAGSSVVAVIAMEHAVALHFQPAQWGVYQKNSIGAILWVAIVVAQLNPDWAGISRTEAKVNKYLCIGGLLASQSRQSWIILVLALGLALLRNPELRRRSKLIVVAAVPVGAVLYYSFSLNARSNPKFNSVSIRFDQIGAAIHVWHLSPIFGEGMRFYNLPQFITVTAPPNVVVDNLASTGIVGSLAFVFLVVVTMRTMYRLPAVLGTLGMVVLFGHYVDGLFDIFWIGVSSIAPIIIAGISLGMADLERFGIEPGTSIASDRRAKAAPLLPTG